jgi:ATP-dependent DNA helicase RecQ
MVRFVEGTDCRRVAILRYFGEEYRTDDGTPLSSCGACDNCLTPREQFDGTTEALKILSCIARVQQKSGFGVGAVHIADIIAGADNEKIRRWDHNTLSTYGVGKERPRQEWIAFTQELVSRGLLRVDHERFGIVQITETGKATMRARATILLTKPLTTTKLAAEKRRELKVRTGERDYDKDLFDRLRKLRRTIADEKGVPAFMVFSDATLQDMAGKKPRTLGEMLGVSGVGERKLDQYGELFLNAIAEGALG